MEIALDGEGEVLLRFIDAKGRTILEERLAVSGSSTVRARRIVPLVLETTEGKLPVAPVLAHRTNDRQRVTFDGQPPASWTRKRCREIKCSPKIAANAVRGLAPKVQRDGQAGFMGEDFDFRSLSDRGD